MKHKGEFGARARVAAAPTLGVGVHQNPENGGCVGPETFKVTFCPGDLTERQPGEAIP